MGDKVEARQACSVYCMEHPFDGYLCTYRTDGPPVAAYNDPYEEALVLAHLAWLKEYLAKRGVDTSLLRLDRRGSHLT